MIKNLDLEVFLARYYQQVEHRIRSLAYRWKKGGIAITGSLNTTNVGDLAIGVALASMIETELKVKTSLYGLRHTKFSNHGLILQAGGDSVHDNSSMRQLQRLVKISCHPTMLIGIGVPGILTKEGQKLLQQLYEQSLFISVRDEQSYSHLSEALSNQDLEKVKITADPAFLLKADYPDKKVQKQRGVVGISARPLLQSGNNEWLKTKKGWSDNDLNILKRNYRHTIHSIIKYLKKNGARPVFIPFETEDLLFYKTELSELNIDRTPLHRDPRKTLDVVASMEYMVCMRYHSLVFSIITQTPMFLISYADKTDALAKLIPNLTLTSRANQFEYVEPHFSVTQEVLESVSVNLFHQAMNNINPIKRFWE